MDIKKEYLYDVEWQSLRVSLMGKFKTLEDLEENIRKLTDYMETGEDPLPRAWRVLNLCNAVKMGYHGQGLRETEIDQRLEEFRNCVSEIYHIFKDIYKLEPWDWRNVERQLQIEKALDPTSFESILRDLKKRQRLVLKKTSPHISRPELTYFLSLMEK